MDMDINLNGKWKNQFNSVMHLKLEEDNTLSGTFQTAIGRPNFDEQFKLTGKINNNTIAFMVDFDQYGSIACWTGRFDEDYDGEVLHTMWHLAQSEGGAEEKMARAVLTGVGTFRKI